MTLQSGRPFTVFMPPQPLVGLRPDVVSGVDPVPAGQGPDNWINAAAYTPPAGPLGTLGRNTHRGPSLQLVDLAVVKGWQMGEDNRLQFRAELFNAFNRPNFGSPNPLLLTPDFGIISSTITPARQIQFGLRYDF